jgi:hypothetical protein
MSIENDGVRPAEQTFADVLNGLSLSGRRSRARHEQSTAERPTPTGRHSLLSDIDLAPGQHAASVRAYAWTGGRTRSDFQLEIETLVSASERAQELIDTLQAEHQSVARLCHQSKSVAEVAAVLSIPLGVVRVLLGDMAGLGLIEVHQNTTGNGDEPDMELLERVLRGLTRLRT